ncbi:MAG: DUF4249 domain-containing protein [Raineya sp.]|jgi:hypothetical protein|nr:DUF4249 domain-containing protein [Raineya sp.]
MKYLSLLLLNLLLVVMLVSCGLERDIDLDLPKYDKKLVVECYLERGKPIRLLLTESQEFLSSSILPPDVSNATVRITNGNKVYNIPYRPEVDSAFGKIYNYTSDEIIPIEPQGEFLLEIRDSKGRKITGRTRFLEKLPVNEITWEFEDKDKEIKEDSAEALVLMRHPVSPSGDFYRFIINKKEKEDYSNQLDFIYRGITATNGEISIGTAYRFKNNDSLQILFFHIEKQFYNYIRSVEDARDAAGNPFAQPAPILSSVEGGIGIFTTLQSDEKYIVVTK